MEPTMASPLETLGGEDHLLPGQLVLVVPLQIGRCGIPSRSIFGERTRASINRTSHHRRMQLILDQSHSIHSLTQVHQAQ